MPDPSVTDRDAPASPLGTPVAIGWVDPQRFRQNRLHEFGCICSQPLRSQVHRAENLVYRLEEK